MVYTHVLNRGPLGVRSPVDRLWTHRPFGLAARTGGECDSSAVRSNGAKSLIIGELTAAPS
jgi:hypothetical protein